MAFLSETIYNSFHNLSATKGDSGETGEKSNLIKGFKPILDQTLSDMPLVGSPLPTVLIIGLYLIVVKIIGPAIMANRMAINPKFLIMYYNALQVLGNGTICYYVSEIIHLL